MSSESAIRIDGVAKCYQIYEQPIDRLKQMLWRGRRCFYREFWALRDISFEVGRGETVGIIGRNGSGKSTLLQIICGILTPTSGRIDVRGRVAALLELGAGFNSEFTGRENVYLNAAILGLSRAEIDSRLDDILAFADIGGFIDQPVKTYSSGMFVRLAFSVAINVEPQILVVDEALAVGDAVFQAKCMARMRQLMDAGVTVLFVSHDLAAVKALCNRAVLLENGRQRAFGSTETVADDYLRLLNEGHAPEERLPSAPVPSNVASTAASAAQIGIGDDVRFRQLAAIQRLGNRKAEYLNVEVLDVRGLPAEAFVHGDRLELRTVVRANADIDYLAFGYHLRDRNGVDVAYSDNLLESVELLALQAGEIHEIRWRFPLPLANGSYSIAVVVSSPAHASGTAVSCSDLTICDFIAVAAQFRIFGEQQVHGYVRLSNEVTLHRLDGDV